MENLNLPRQGFSSDNESDEDSFQDPYPTLPDDISMSNESPRESPAAEVLSVVNDLVEGIPEIGKNTKTVKDKKKNRKAPVKKRKNPPNPDDTDSAMEEESNKKTSKRKPRFVWSDEMSDQVVASILEAKTRFEMDNREFEKDLVSLYEEVRKIMAEKYKTVFGPVSQTMIDEINDTDDVKQQKEAQIVKVKIRPHLENPPFPPAVLSNL